MGGLAGGKVHNDAVDGGLLSGLVAWMLLSWWLSCSHSGITSKRTHCCLLKARRIACNSYLPLAAVPAGQGQPAGTAEEAN